MRKVAPRTEANSDAIAPALASTFADEWDEPLKNAG
jgi:hypothetical protein